jgi:hypothetical protein
MMTTIVRRSRESGNPRPLDPRVREDDNHYPSFPATTGNP